MTFFGPDRIASCRACGRPMRLPNLASHTRVRDPGWTDGWFEESDFPIGPLIACPHCGELQASAGMTILGEKWPGASHDLPPTPSARAPSVEALVAGVKKGMGSREMELAARLRIWWGMNYARRKPGQSAAPDAFEAENLRWLESALSESMWRDLLRKVEVLRESGRFVAAKKLLRGARAELEFMERLVDAGDPLVRRLDAAPLPPWDGYHDEVAAEMVAAKNGDPDAAWRLFARFDTGDRVPRDAEAADEWLGRAAQGGHLEARTRLGLGFAEFPLRLKWLAPAAKDGHPAAQRALGLLGDSADEVLRGLGELRERGTPEAIALLLPYRDAAEAAQGAPGDRAHAAEVLEAVRAAIAAIHARTGK